MSKVEALTYLQHRIQEYSCLQNSQLEVYQGSLPIGSSTYKVISTVFEVSPHLITAKLLDEYDCDVIILINLKKQAVLFRKRKGCTLNLGKLAKSLSQGGGSPDIAGCILNDNIINITKLLC